MKIGIRLFDLRFERASNKDENEYLLSDYQLDKKYIQSNYFGNEDNLYEHENINLYSNI